MRLPPDARSAYQTNDPEELEPRKVKHELVREVKRIVEDTALLDIAPLDQDELRGLVDDARRLADRLARGAWRAVGEAPRGRAAGLAALRGLGAQGGLATPPRDASALLERWGTPGGSTPLAPPLQMHMDDDGITRGHAWYGDAYE